MPDRILISGPAGGGKSAAARKLIEEADEPTVLADYQSLTVALLALQRDAEGKYPARPAWILPTVEYLRRTTITQARERGLGIVATNSDGSPERRRFLLAELGEGAEERIIDPGREVVEARLADPATGELSEDCAGAIGRWYGRL